MRIVISFIVLLCVAIGLVIYGNNQRPEPTFHKRLFETLAKPLPGWQMVEKEIASTPEMKAAVDELLNYDDGVFVDYVKGSNRISVYIAYWTPGKMSYRLVAVHTPDVCWVGNGWKKQKSWRVTDLKTSSGVEIPPCEGRLFVANERPEYVWFWHMVGPESKSYGTGFAPPWYAVFTDMLSRGLDQREEQFFIRISSDEPLDDPVLAEMLQHIMDAIPFPHGERE